MLIVLDSQLNILTGIVVLSEGHGGLVAFVCICQDVYISTNIILVQLIIFVRTSYMGLDELTYLSGLW